MTGLVFGSVCSGIEAASQAWNPLGWRCAFVSEIEKFPRAVLKHHHPEVPLHGDFTTIGARQYEPIDLLVGGTPCQSFSIAGLRGGLDDDRGNLALEYLKLADRTRPRWPVWENVPGVLSSGEGRDFGSILGGMVELGYGVAYRVLDAQYFGVAQRRRRVFLVGYRGDWRRTASVLFERHSLSGHPEPSRQSREGIASFPQGGFGTFRQDDLAGSQKRSGGDLGGGSETLILTIGRSDVEAVDNNESAAAFAHTPAVARVTCVHGTQGPCVNVEMAHTLGRNNGAENAIVYGIARDAIDRSGEGAAGNAAERSDLGIIEDTAQTIKAKGPGAVAFALRGREGGAMPEIGGDVANTVRTPGGGASVPMVASSSVRRLTPRECERLQGFPDDYTLIPWRGGMAPDGPRYKALGNSMAVPVMAWIGRRIAAVDALAEPLEPAA